MIHAGLFDGSFPGQESFTLGGDNCAEKPRSLCWHRDTRQPVNVFTDMRLREAPNHPGKRLALLIEPNTPDRSHYETAAALLEKGQLDAILTHDYEFKLSLRNMPVYYYPPGGSWIDPSITGLYHKTKTFAMIVSEKTRLPGHALRHAIARDHGDIVDTFGAGSPRGRFDSKAAVLSPYTYAIVIESIKRPGYFTEKLIDALTLGCVPLYNGDPYASDIFPGLPTWENRDQLWYYLNVPPIVSFVQSAAWYRTAMRLRCAEDNIVAVYSHLFRPTVTRDEG